MEEPTKVSDISFDNPLETSTLKHTERTRESVISQVVRPIHSPLRSMSIYIQAWLVCVCVCVCIYVCIYIYTYICSLLNIWVFYAEQVVLGLYLRVSHMGGWDFN